MSFSRHSKYISYPFKITLSCTLPTNLGQRELQSSGLLCSETGNFLPTFLNPWRCDQYVVLKCQWEITTTHHIMTQKSAVLIYLIYKLQKWKIIRPTETSTMPLKTTLKPSYLSSYLLEHKYASSANMWHGEQNWS